MGLGQLDVIELNEALAAQAIVILLDPGLVPDQCRVNSNSGAIALGHPATTSQKSGCQNQIGSSPFDPPDAGTEKIRY
ncbi:MAG TPA: hypothetical protein QF469_07750 [Sphingomonas sanguinis]|uniref:hypothetical protein n=1 Tax=Sphingomonas sanguinis TaxID=33051 RepID=UPI002AC086F6|nr:hypothetical protein [Sphingomonas sanguinis]